jgi:hypothetical protein
MLYPSIAFFRLEYHVTESDSESACDAGYIVRIHLEKTGKGILIVTVILMALYFIFAHKHPFNLRYSHPAIQNMKYYVIAGEASGDLHASRLIREIKLIRPDAEFRCWGGDRCRKKAR